jgi:hypothetical protein
MKLKKLIDTYLWDNNSKFYKVLPLTVNASLVDVKELLG